MKPILSFIAAGLLAGCAAAGDPHDHSAAAAGQPGMEEHMKLMRAQMAQMRAATEPKEKERLMNEHMKTMEQSMAKMRGMMGCGKM